MKWKDLRAGWRLSPHLQPWQKKIVRQMRARVPAEPDLLWLLSSGTQSVRSLKAIGLTEEKILISAAAVNEHLESTPADRWLLALPDYHVGGLSVYARAHLAGARISVFDGRWSAARFTAQAEQNKISLTSLVPTQVFDLVAAKLRSPASLRAAVIGGGALSAELYRAARALGWPVLPSYGLTECCSQVATATLSSLRAEAYPSLKILAHVEVRLADARLSLRSPALCRWIAGGRADGTFTLEDPLRDGWLATEDIGTVEGDRLQVRGRGDDVVKVRGHLVPLQEVTADVARFFSGGPPAVLALKDPRSEHRLVLVTDAQGSIREGQRQIALYNAQAAPERRVQLSCWLREIPRGELGKIKKGELRELVSRLGGEA